jgi:hypothetical protein
MNNVVSFVKKMYQKKQDLEKRFSKDGGLV